MDFRLSDDQALLRRTVREFAETEMRPHVMEWDESQHFPMDLLPKLADLGLMGIQFAEEYGGAAMSSVDYCICIEELARVCPAISLSVAAHNGLCTSHIGMFGTDAQKRQYLPRLVRGEVLGAWGLTEASAGSDAAGMRTMAVRSGDEWVLNGSKSFITHGKIGGVMVVIAITDRAKGHRGISAFIVDAGHAGHERRQEGEQARDARERHERGGVPGLPRAGGEPARRAKDRVSSTRSRCSMPAASASRRWPSVLRRAHTRRR